MYPATVTPASQRRPRRERGKAAKQPPTLTGVHISSTYDALCVLNGVRLGFLHSVEHRLDPEEREDIQSGYVYVYEESHGSKARQGIERWTDGKRWSASRSKENFLFYEENSAGSEDPDTSEAAPTSSPVSVSDDPNVPLIDYISTSDGPGRLTKMTFSSWVKLPTDTPDRKRKWLLVCYWQKPHVKTLPKAYEIECLIDHDIPEGMFFSSRAGKNKQQGLPIAGMAYDTVLRRPSDLEALRWRKKQYYLTGGQAPLPVGPGTRPEDDPAFYAARTWGPAESVPSGPSVTDARFRFHDQHQRTFPHHRTRRDELEDIPITERPPHWRPAQGAGSVSTGPPSPTVSVSVSQHPTWAGRHASPPRDASPPPAMGEVTRYRRGAPDSGSSGPASLWPPAAHIPRAMHAISSMRDQPAVPPASSRAGPVSPLTPGSDSPARSPAHTHAYNLPPLPAFPPYYPHPHLHPQSHPHSHPHPHSTPPTPPYSNPYSASASARSPLPSMLAQDRKLPPIELAFHRGRNEYDSDVISRWDRTIGVPDWAGRPALRL